LYGLLALSLASIGIYGVASYIIAQRTREIGVRMALGAPRWAVLVLTLRTSLLPIVVGLAIGVLAVLAGGRAVATQLYGVRSYDPLILGSAAAALVLSAAAATLVPARRAASIDPLRALRND
jgi:ABC-type antimicrobial peptide transport system permease subunit